VPKHTKALKMSNLDPSATSWIPHQTSERISPITTQRLLLREFRITDIQNFYNLDSLEESARYQDWYPKTMKVCFWQVISAIQDSRAIPRSTFELIVEKDECMVGRVGASISHVSHNDKSSPGIHFNLWYSFFPSAQGKGYATEAMTAFIGELVKRQEGDVELEIECDPRNRGSWRLAERLGFERISCVERAYESKGEWVGSVVLRRVLKRLGNED
jgi:RimJ/RimL family protein N-acetyltransferase